MTKEAANSKDIVYLGIPLLTQNPTKCLLLFIRFVQEVGKVNARTLWPHRRATNKRGPPPLQIRSGIYFGMQRDAIAFAVAANCTETVWTDRMNVVDEFAAMLGALCHRVANATVHIQIQQNSAIPRNFIGAGDQAAAIAFVMRDHAE